METSSIASGGRASRNGSYDLVQVFVAVSLEVLYRRTCDELGVHLHRLHWLRELDRFLGQRQQAK